jgi:hypothetical protein
MAKSRARRPTKVMTERVFAPYALAIGHLARSWNQLHENLCLIFCRVATRTNTNIGHAIWYDLKSDRVQRGVLKAACGAPGAIDTKNWPTALEDIDWLLEKTRGVADQRNAALHAPFMVGMETTTREMIIMSDFFPHNPFSKQLRGKDILSEISYYRVKCDILKEYAVSIWMALGHSERAWPSRPSWPNREQAKAQQKRGNRR